MAINGSSIPIVRLASAGANSDLDDYAEKQLAQQVRNACRDVGFFYLEGHGIESSFLNEVMEQSKLLFDLPLDEKNALTDKVMSRGYTAMGEETLDPAVQTCGDTKEGYYIADDFPQNHPLYNPEKLRGPNQWPSQQRLANFKPVMELYLTRVGEIAMRVVRLIALSLGLPRDFFDPHFQEPMRFIRLLHYDRTQSEPGSGVFACGAHSDYGMLTLLLTDEHPGLQILSKDGCWIDVPPNPLSFIVNLGDMLERWTNGEYKSTLHRVLTSGNSERYSIPYFFEPNFDAKVECLDACCSRANPPRYPPTTAGLHLLNKYQETHADFKPE